MFCTKCGASITDGAVFCGRCGADMSGGKRHKEETARGQEAVRRASAQSSQEGKTKNAKESVPTFQGYSTRAWLAYIPFLIAMLLNFIF